MQEIAVIGSGLNGLAVAFGLAEKGSHVTIFEEKTFGGNFKQDFRTSFFSHNTIAFFEKFRKEIEENSGMIEYIYSYKTEEKPIVELAGSNLGYVVDNFFIKELLVNFLRNHKNVVIHENTQVETISDWQDTIKINSQKFKIAVCASGANSSIHKKLGLEQKLLPYNQVALVFDIKHQNDHQNIAIEAFDESCIAALLPKKNKNTSSVILSLKNRYAEKLQDDRLLEFLHAKTHRARHIGEILEIPSKICRYPLAMKYMNQQLHGNMIFIGDSFHAVHPVLGQGFNMSLKDIQKLCNHLAEMQSLGVSLNQNLQSLPLKNFANHLKIGSATHIFGGAFISKNPVLKLLTSASISVGASISTRLKTKVLEKLL